MDSPEYFLSVVYARFDEIIGDDHVLCAGFERKSWRSEQLADHIIEWLPEFALKHSELEQLEHHNAIKLIKNAAKIVYQSDKYKRRGEFGEILLHIAIRQLYETIPAVNKIFYKSAANETVKGFDAIHVVRRPDGLQLWVGETKFYRSLDKGVNDVVAEIVDHLETDYLRSEFIFIANKIDPSWPESESLHALIDRNRSMDQVFSSLCIPVLLTYESPVTRSGDSLDENYSEKIENEVRSAFEKLRVSLKEKYEHRYQEDFEIALHVIFIPMANKEELLDRLESKLKGLQA